MATHSIILAWRIPWTEETGELLSMGSQRIGYSNKHYYTTYLCSSVVLACFFFFLIISLSDFDIRVILSSKTDFGNVPSLHF